MYKLRRISMMNWNLIELEDLEVFGTTALIGGVGVGKSTILDAIQTVLNGNQKSKLKLNRAAGFHTSRRSVLEYCLGHTEDAIAQGKTRSHCDTILALTFRDEELNHSVSLGLVLYAEEGAPREETRCRFIAPGVDFSFAKFADRTPEGYMMVESWEAILDRVKELSGQHYIQTTSSRAEFFVENFLKTMRPMGVSPDPKQFQKRFRNAIAFEEIANPTDFIRNFVLEEDPIDTELLRSNLETWDEIAQKIQTTEKKLAAARTQRNRYARYATQQFDHAETNFSIAWHQWQAESKDADALELEIKAHTEELGMKEEEVEELKAEREAETHSLEKKKEKEREAGITDKRALAEVRLKAAQEKLSKDHHDLEQVLHAMTAVLETKQLNNYLPSYVHDAQAAAEELKIFIKGLNPNDRIPDEDHLKSIARRIIAAKPAKDSLENIYQSELETLAGMRSRLNKMTLLTRTQHQDAPILDPHVTGFMQKLLSQGISSSALPELVDIREGMDDWVPACEAALGPFREAVFVAPKDLPKAHAILRSARRHGKQDFWRVRLINTERILEGKSVREAKEKSIVSILETNEELVRKFLDSQFGHIIRVDTPEELRWHNNAIMKDGAQSQRLSLRVHEQRPLVLGQAAQAALKLRLKYDLEQLSKEVKAKEHLTMRMSHGIKRFEQLGHFDLAALAGHLATLRDSYDQIQILREERDREVSPEMKSLLVEIEAHQNKITQISDLIEDIQVRVISDIRDNITRKTNFRDRHIENKEKAFTEVEAIRLADKGEPYESFRQALRDMGHEQRGRNINSLETRLKQQRWDKSSDNRREIERLRKVRDTLIADDKRINSTLRNISEFLKDYDEDIRISERSPEEILLWLVALVGDIQNDELLKYHSQVAEIQKRTQEEVREMLVVRLSDKFKRAQEELRNLNKRLKKHKFEGLTYLFTWAVDPEMMGLYRMTQKVANDPERAQLFLADGGDPLLNEAVEQIRAIFAGGLDAGKWADYRQYFTYELRMTHDDVSDDQIDTQNDGNLRGVTFTGNLSDRVGKGSGGQKQTPYYVAIAASMAAAYYPGVRHASDRGMGLVCFDEAFSKLDINNTQNLLKFFKDLGLQVLVAAPEEKRTSFMEIMDTVVNISKPPGGTDLYLRTVAIGEQAKRALQDANPDRKGIEGFRDELAASQIKSAQ
jgi:hypothetical protein